MTRGHSCTRHALRSKPSKVLLEPRQHVLAPVDALSLCAAPIICRLERCTCELALPLSHLIIKLAACSGTIGAASLYLLRHCIASDKPQKAWIAQRVRIRHLRCSLVGVVLRSFPAQSASQAVLAIVVSSGQADLLNAHLAGTFASQLAKLCKALEQVCRRLQLQHRLKATRAFLKLSGTASASMLPENGKEPQQRFHQKASRKSCRLSMSPRSSAIGMSLYMTGSPSAACSLRQKQSSACSSDSCQQ